jgi:hypothetical protein
MASSPQAPASATIDVTNAAQGTRIFVDGVEVGAAPGVFAVEPGEHVIGARKEEGPTMEKIVIVPPGASTPVALSAAVPKVDSGMEKPFYERAWFWVVVGVGAGVAVMIADSPSQNNTRAREALPLDRPDHAGMTLVHW